MAVAGDSEIAVDTVVVLDTGDTAELRRINGDQVHATVRLDSERSVPAVVAGIEQGLLLPVTELLENMYSVAQVGQELR